MNLFIALFLNVVLFITVALTSTYYVKYDEEKHTNGLTIWSVDRAKEMFKGSKPNETEGEKVKVNYEVLDNEDDIMYFSQSDMEKMAANEGDLVYLSDARKFLGGLKSVHSVFGKPHFEDGKVYISKEHLASAQFVEGKILIAEKEM
ncbi:MAG TPA: sodium:solute symporter family protein, partial [Melioribacteraceae bacterium]|nr:sodium:solute symporter family protein [Melioribacteraceae bacterium]